MPSVIVFGGGPLTTRSHDSKHSITEPPRSRTPPPDTSPSAHSNDNSRNSSGQRSLAKHECVINKNIFLSRSPPYGRRERGARAAGLSLAPAAPLPSSHWLNYRNDISLLSTVSHPPQYYYRFYPRLHLSLTDMARLGGAGVLLTTLSSRI
ncbi:hypothetical protein J6590_042834 [Homalodisca vitripennis]|nr:hypothetical protein J6590_042834 [Homalodisca vitripennis]